MLHMNFNSLLNKYNITKRNGIIHVGGNTGEEIPEYKDLGFQRILVFEPLRHSFDKISNESGVYKVNCAVGDTNGKINMHISELTNPDGSLNIGESASILKPKNHLVAYPAVKFYPTTHEVDIVTLDTWFLNTSTGLRPTDFSCIVLDVQGYEAQVIIGAKDILKNVDCVYAEIATTEIYEGNTHVNQLNFLLKQYGFVMREHWLDPHGSGEAFYTKESTREF